MNFINTAVLKKIPLKTIFIVLVGIGVTAGSVGQLQTWVDTHQEKVKVPVVKQKVTQYSMIGPGMIEMQDKLKLAADPYAVKTLQEIEGKVAVTDLIPGEQIRPDKLANTDILLQPGEAFVTVRIEKPEQALAGQIRANSIVNVMWTAGPNSPSSVLAEKARVMSLMDEGLKPVHTASVFQGVVTNATGQAPIPKYVMLKVKERESYEFTRPLTGGFILLSEVSKGVQTPVPPAQNGEATPTTQQGNQPPDSQNNTPGATPNMSDQPQPQP
ncbi:SAF domain protein [Desulforamulus reducens MI-1]|uniref:SAF domain protein n=1 Tax=Desulforamulus reducens (strain ATCC BAA-1160 / DSM 100696 / MI-1) TaxID=349161 RepID=A4J2Q9_DESRM|nr:SAF domain-containing protein [Desulforamulus reducens]ABO49362.1 SAF domain protein [Desulforamulus reducens MI-1]